MQVGERFFIVIYLPYPACIDFLPPFAKNTPSTYMAKIQIKSMEPILFGRNISIVNNF